MHLYIHWPFCRAKCPYCDFNSHVREKIDYQTWLAAYLNSLDDYDYLLKKKEIKTIFFGGGTPSLMEPFIPETIISHLYKKYKIAANVEITLEANPTSVETSKMKDFKRAGINRISLGVQSFNQDELSFLGREHSGDEAIAAIKMISSIFDSYSFDLIYALPNQDVEAWKQSLKFALPFIRDHVSMYQLTIEKGTKFYSKYQRGEFVLPNEEVASDMYNITAELLAQKKLEQYEVSNYAAIGRESQHNLAYWEYKDYLGIGPGAHSRIEGYEVMMTHAPEKWLETKVQLKKKLSDEDKFKEFLLMGLRLKKGIEIKRANELFNNRFLEKLSQKKLNYFLEEGLVTIDEYLKISPYYMVVANSIIEGLID